MTRGKENDARTERALCVLGLATVWPSVHNQIFYPLTLTFNKPDAPSVLTFYLLYALIALATCAVLLKAKERRRKLFGDKAAVLAVDALGVLGLAMLAACGFDTLISTVLVGVATGFCAVSMPVLFVFWSSRVVEESRQVAIDVLLSYLIASALVALRLALGVHTVVFNIALGAASCAFVVLAGAGGQRDVPGSAAELKELPNQIIVPCFIVLVLLQICVLYLNPLPASYAYPAPFRIYIYVSAMAVSLVLVVVYYLGRQRPYRASLMAFALLATGSVAAMLVTGFVRPLHDDMGNYPLIGCKILIEMFVWLLVLDAARLKNLSIMLPATLYLAICLFAPNLLGALAIGIGLFDGLGDAVLLVVCAVSAVAIAVVFNLILGRILLHPRSAREDADGTADSQNGSEGGEAGSGEARPTAPAPAPDPLEAAFSRVQEEFGLSERQMDVVRLAYRNRTSRRIGEELFISEGTVKTHLKTIYKRMGIHSKQDLIDVVDAHR